MDFADCLDTTQDNTKVMRIMSDFHQFLSQNSGGASTGLKPLSSTPFNVSKSRDERSMSSGVSNLSSVAEDCVLISNLRKKISQLEASNLSTKKAMTESNLKMEKRNERLYTELYQVKEKCDRLQLKNKQLTEQNIEMVDKVKDAELERDLEVSKWKESFEQLENLKQEHEERISNQLCDYEMNIQNLMEETMTVKAENVDLSSSLEETCVKLEYFKNRYHKLEADLQDYENVSSELVKAKQEIHELSLRLTDAENADRTAKCFKEDMNRLRLLESDYKRLCDENSNLKENRENIILLNEQLISAESKLIRAQEKCAKFDELEGVNQSLMDRLRNRESQPRDNHLIESFEHQISQLSRNLQLLEDTKTTLQSEYNILESKYTEEKRMRDMLNAKLEQQQEVSSSVNAQLLRLRKRAGLLAHERDSIRAILQSYDAELTMTSHTTQLSKRLANVEEANKRLHVRIEQLEKELQAKTEEAMRQRLLAKQTGLVAVEKKEESMLEAGDQAAPATKEKSELQAKIDKYEKERETLLEKVERLEAFIEQRKIKGDFNPENTKVIHFTMNPADLAHQKSKRDLIEMREENTKLKKKLKELQEGHDVSVSEIAVPQAVRHQLSMAELKNTRLKEIFSQKIHEFRQACYSLTGYRIDTSTDSKFKLVSMYAESEADFLLFEMTPEGEMQLLETEYSKSLTDLISLHLHHQNSLPMFLSALSISLFGQQTMISV